MADRVVTISGLIRAKLGKIFVKPLVEKVKEIARVIRYRAMDREKAVDWIKKESKGRIFAVEVIKRTNGAKRYMVCRYGVRMNIKGVGLAFDPDAYQLIVVWDVQKAAWRMISIPGMRGILITRKDSDRAALVEGKSDKSLGEYFRIN